MFKSRSNIIDFGVLNAHSFDMLFCPISYFMIRKKPHKKYSALAEYALQKGIFLFDFSESSFFSRRDDLFTRFFGPIFIFFEVLLWCKLNDIPFAQVRFYFKFNNYKILKILSFTYKGCQSYFGNKIKILNNSERIYFHLSHYMIDTAAKASFVRQFSGKVVLLGDSDFSSNGYLLKYFSGIPFEVLPFNPQKRFVSDGNLSRKCVVLVGGTTHNLSAERPSYLYADFINYFMSDSYHYLRRLLADVDNPRLVRSTSTFQNQKVAAHDKYYSVDLPSLMRSVMFVAYGDEISGAPAISNLEGIACGCIAFMSDEAVSGLPLVKGVHYYSFPPDLSSFLQLLDGLNVINFEESFVERCKFSDKFHRFTLSQCDKIFGNNIW